MKFFVTGGTGFLGRYCLRELTARGHEVVALHRGNAPCEGREIGHLRWMRGDMGAVEPGVLQGVDVLLHLAAAGVSPQPIDWAPAIDANVRAPMALLTAAVVEGVRRIMAVGTMAEYGASCDRYDRVPTNAPLCPVGAYAVSKAAAAVALAGLGRTFGLELAVLRVSNVFGEGQHSSNLWPQVREAVRAGEDFHMTPGKQVRDFISADQAAWQVVQACESLPLEAGHPRVMHICSGVPVTLRDFVAKLWAEGGATGQLKVGALPYREHEMMRCVPQLTPW